MTSLSSDALATVVSHELEHFREPASTRVARVVSALAVVPLVLVRPCYGTWGASGVILEVSGVPFMDSHEFQDLRRVMHMAELLGARCMLVGLRPGIIMHLMDSDVDVRGLRAVLGLDEALHAMRGLRDATHG